MTKLRVSKKGFTLIELVLVLVVAGILSSIAISKINSNSLILAARSLSQDIYILRDLALNYDVYDYTTNYDKSYWQIYFHCVANTKTSYNKYKCNHQEFGYSIFSDSIGSSSSNPDANELAKDLFDKTKLIGTRYAGISVDDNLLTTRTNLTKSFGITKIDVFYNLNNKYKKTHRIMVNELGELFASSYTNKSKTYNLIKANSYIIRLSKSTNIDQNNSICIVINNVGFTTIPKNNNGQLISNIKKPIYCHNL
ncbi:prepilin-type N-terminal cleavage/methylation domain-containing protein [Campylobacter sp. 2018MI13]|uniref:pilus assembly FimT family protein n=1 Tax=Campylobacter sp. 2018MI13 TaxID=2836737 RepID=UPI001BDAB856|nr:prepilin-type N-terminal cleavage/methylation domain-containing protein [Campylobacter sp. 2018MI13]MBT0881916.1 prepilin-type N-terminal cleavage/methylation domain-containing protein [Campylobacter sp. 2018MI13]